MHYQDFENASYVIIILGLWKYFYFNHKHIHTPLQKNHSDFLRLRCSSCKVSPDWRPPFKFNKRTNSMYNGPLPSNNRAVTLSPPMKYKAYRSCEVTPSLTVQKFHFSSNTVWFLKTQPLKNMQIMTFNGVGMNIFWT